MDTLGTSAEGAQPRQAQHISAPMLRPMSREARAHADQFAMPPLLDPNAPQLRDFCAPQKDRAERGAKCDQRRS